MPDGVGQLVVNNFSIGQGNADVKNNKGKYTSKPQKQRCEKSTPGECVGELRIGVKKDGKPHAK